MIAWAAFCKRVVLSKAFRMHSSAKSSAVGLLEVGVGVGTEVGVGVEVEVEVEVGAPSVAVRSGAVLAAGSSWTCMAGDGGTVGSGGSGGGV